MKEKIKELKTKIIEGHDNENITSKSLKIAKDRVTKKGSRYILLPEETILKHTNLYIAIVNETVTPVDDKLFFFKVPPHILQVYKAVNNPKTHEVNYVIPHKDLIVVTKGFDQDNVVAKGEEAKKEEVKTEKKEEVKIEKKIEKKVEAKKEVEKKEPVVEEKEIEQKFQDIPYSEMTLRDYAAIQLNKPVSNKAWLNEIIKSK